MVQSIRPRHLLGIAGLELTEIELLLNSAEALKDVLFRPLKKVPALRGKVIVTLFFEPSTRTRTSFELAGKYMGADVVNINTVVSSVAKGESLVDTACTLQAMAADVLVIRHSSAGAPHLLASRLNSSVINAGDGAHEHPTQALLDIFTIREKLGRVDGLNVTILGDIQHSRVARSNILALQKMGATVKVAGPATLMPAGLECQGVEVYHSADEALRGADAIIVLRLQLERQKIGLFPSIREYSRHWGLNARRLSLAAPGALVLHPGPVNRGVEISSEVADGLQSVINEQVTNGLAVRMAVLYWLVTGGRQLATVD